MSRGSTPSYTVLQQFLLPRLAKSALLHTASNAPFSSCYAQGSTAVPCSTFTPTAPAPNSSTRSRPTNRKTPKPCTTRVACCFSSPESPPVLTRACALRQWGEEERRMRAQAPRRCVDIAGSIMHHIINRAYVPTAGGDPPIGTGGLPWSVQPHSSYARRMVPPAVIASNPASGICTQVREERETTCCYDCVGGGVGVGVCCSCYHGCCLATQPLVSARRFEMDEDVLFVVVVALQNVLIQCTQARDVDKTALCCCSKVKVVALRPPGAVFVSPMPITIRRQTPGTVLLSMLSALVSAVFELCRSKCQTQSHALLGRVTHGYRMEDSTLVTPALPRTKYTPPQWVKTSTNKQRCPVFCLAWAPAGVTRCITGNSSGEFTLWKDGSFNFVTILQVRWYKEDLCHRSRGLGCTKQCGSEGCVLARCTRSGRVNS